MDAGQTPQTDTPGGGGRKALTVVGVLGAIAVNIAAFVLSAAAITAVAEAAGMDHRIAWAMVAAVDGLMITGTVVFIANKLRGRSVWYPLTVLGAGVLLSIVCNALHAKAGGGHVVHLDENAKMGVSAIPAVSLALSFHLIADMVKDSLGVSRAPSGDRQTGRLDNVTRPRQTLSGGPQTLVQTPPPVASQTVSAPPAQTSQTAPPRQQPDADQTPPEAPTQTPSARPVKPAQTARRRPAKTAPEPVAKLVPIDRGKVRELLADNRDMSAADLARELGRPNTGTLRTVRAAVLAELEDAAAVGQ
jgi:Protein of unknown function (DUF2637)